MKQFIFISLYLVGPVIGLIIFYYLVKLAVKNDIIEARSSRETVPFTTNSNPERTGSAEKMKLQNRYDRGEISFEEYNLEWNKLNAN